MSALPILLLLIFLLSLSLSIPLHCLATSVSLVGVNYGRVADNLPPPTSVPRLLSSIDVGRVRIYDADPSVLRAFANTGLDLTISLPDRCIPAFASDPSQPLAWLRANLLPFLPATKVTAIVVGNEVLTGNDTAVARCLVPAMEALHSALASLSLDGQVAVTTASSLAVLATPSYPPSGAAFRQDLFGLVCQLLGFLSQTGSPFLINAYPYFAYADEPDGVDLGFALLEPSSAGFTDPGTGLHYANLLHAQVDAVYHAIAGATAGNCSIEVRVSETGWPSAGDPHETAATPENAAKYNGNLMRLVMQNKGTPLSRGAALRVYIFALFNENLKPGPASERNFGLFKADGTPAYDLGISFPCDNSTAGGGGTGGGGPAMDGSSDGYYSVSAATRLKERMSLVALSGVVGVWLTFLKVRG